MYEISTPAVGNIYVGAFRRDATNVLFPDESRPTTTRENAIYILQFKNNNYI